MIHRKLCLGALTLALVSFAFVPTAPSASAFETSAREAFLIDTSTGTVLLEKKADQSMPPASMSKIMTTYMVFERLDDGRLSLDDKLPVSKKAWKKGGSKMFVKVGNEVRVEDLLRGVIVQSGNDACIVLAEGLSGSEDAFAAEMTAKAHELGLTGSSFANATGWPDPNQRMTARDLATLAQLVIKNHHKYYHYYSEKEFVWGGIKQGNRNPLLYKNLGADGLKTGHTSEAGYGLTASAVQDGRRLIMVLNGMASIKERAEESARVLSWGFREFGNYALFKGAEVVEEAPVWLGDSATVPLIVADPLLVTLPRKSRAGMVVKVAYDSPLPAPIQEGQQLAMLTVSAPDRADIKVPLVAGASVGQLGPLSRIMASLKFLIFGAP